MRLIDADALEDNLETAIAVYKRNAKYDKTLLRQVDALKFELKIIKDAPTFKVSGKMIDADAFAEAVDKLQWYSLHCNGEMLRGAVCEEDAFYKASDIYTEINKAVTIRADLIELKTGHWEITDAYPHNVYCSECYTRFAQTHWAVWEDGSLPRKFCPNCGARMERNDE